MSALPDLLDTDRLPCLTTRAPAAAASKPVPVDRFTHCRSEAANLLGSFTFGTQPGEKRPCHRRRHITVCELVHQRIGLLLGQRLSIKQSVELRAELFVHVVIAKKFAISRSPSGVSTLSG